MFKNKLTQILYLLLIILPVIVVFKNIFYIYPFSFGDAPYFYMDTLASLLSEPSVWVTRGANFGGINQFLWLSPIMAVYGFLGKYLLLDNQAIVRILFYIPALILSILGPYILTKYLNFSKTVSFFSSLFYCLNTYFILLIDGGQVGLALAYGVFPIVLYFIKKFIDVSNTVNFFWAYVFGMLLCIIDPRIYIILFSFLAIWTFFKKESLKSLFVLQIPILLSNLYWLYPMIKIKPINTSYSVLDLQTSSLINSLLLYAPHWPDNIFGKTVAPEFIFAIIPIFIFGSFLFKEKHKDIKAIALIFLIFAFLGKGANSPFGQIYSDLILKIPFAIAFRDSSKFFIPLMLCAGILIGETVEKVNSHKFTKVILYLLLLFLIWPALSGKMNFNLSERRLNDDMNKVYLSLQNEDGSYNTLWFPEKHPMVYETFNKPALDARDLIKINTISSINVSEDPFNFLNDVNFPKKLAKLGIKYIFLSGDPRNIYPSEDDLKRWSTVSKLISNNPNLKPVNWNTSFQIFEVSDFLPKFYKVHDLIGVVGPHLSSDMPAIYFEDGKFDPMFLENKDSNSAKLLFNNSGEQDLIMSFLQKYFVGTGNTKTNEWAYYSTDKYLKAKYELLIRNFIYDDFDYNKGISFSTKMGEKIEFNFKNLHLGEYVLAVRKANELNKFEWKIINHSINIIDKNFSYEYINEKDFDVVNVIALIPKKDFDEAEKLSQHYINYFGVIKNENDYSYKWDTVSVVNEDTLKYLLTTDKYGFWLILNENYNSLWAIRNGEKYFNSIPINSEVNGFYFEPTWNDLHIEFKGQEYFRWGLYYASVSILLTLIILLYIHIKNE
jgi:hypothetical protein